MSSWQTIVPGLFALVGSWLQPAQASSWITLQAEQTVQWLELASQVDAVSQSTVSAQISGRILELPFDVNDFVPQGAVIVRFTDTEPKARHQQARAFLQESDSRLQEQQAELTRVQQLFQQKLLAKAALDQASANFKSAVARQQQAKAALAAAAAQLEQTVVRAPFAGILQQRLVEIGELAVPGTPLLRGLSLAHLRLQAQLPLAQWQLTQQQPAAELRLTDGTVLDLGQPKLTFAPQADKQSHSMQLRLNLPAADYAALGIFPGSWQRLRLQLGTASIIKIPAAAVLWRSEASLVWLQQGTKVLLQPVRLTKLSDGNYQLISGLSAGDHIAADALQQLTAIHALAPAAH